MKDFIEIINTNGIRGLLNISLITEVSENEISGKAILVYNNQEIPINESYEKFLRRLTDIADVEEV